MRSVRCLGQMVMVEFKATVPSASIAATIFEVCIQRHVVPKGQKGMEFTDVASGPQRCGQRAENGIAFVRHGLAQCTQGCVLGFGPGRCHWM